MFFVLSFGTVYLLLFSSRIQTLVQLIDFATVLLVQKEKELTVEDNNTLLILKFKTKKQQ